MAKDVRFMFDQWAVQKIERRYNPEYDIPHAPCPEVSWVEYALLQMILELEERISALERAVHDHDRELDATA